MCHVVSDGWGSHVIFDGRPACGVRLYAYMIIIVRYISYIDDYIRWLSIVEQDTFNTCPVVAQSDATANHNPQVAFMHG